ncbi:MAG: 23S rRNA (guanosine(2251)-2'-O)-methyltransferase RlmB [Magnetococcales bacterium]|nr:23S rRNA (guanosine(2251)-2'-O)-methyltransferase RlmB [Magnetococcales bacterium]
MEHQEQEWVFGLNPVLALLTAAQRPIESMVALSGGRGEKFHRALTLAKERGFRPRLVDRQALDRLTGTAAHQGIALRVGVRVQPSFDQLLQRLTPDARDLVIILDGVEDPRNLGAMIRTAEAFGALAVVLPKDRTAPLSGTAVKASAGAAERMDTIRVTNLARAMKSLQNQGVQIIGLEADAGYSLANHSFQGPVALVLGNEGKGLRRLTREHCDILAAIPIQGGAGSLNVSVACGIASHICRDWQRKNQNGSSQINAPSS